MFYVFRRAREIKNPITRYAFFVSWALIAYSGVLIIWTKQAPLWPLMVLLAGWIPMVIISMIQDHLALREIKREAATFEAEHLAQMKKDDR